MTIVPVDAVHSVEISSFDKIVTGASIRYGRHTKKVNLCVVCLHN
ncbi:MAG: hypothetical protein RQ982_09050 [Gammaproteobacteria bacterium]|nr:hypothetical protein [Gammaproteobacteria bacterium]